MGTGVLAASAFGLGPSVSLPGELSGYVNVRQSWKCDFFFWAPPIKGEESVSALLESGWPSDLYWNRSDGTPLMSLGLQQPDMLVFLLL